MADLYSGDLAVLNTARVAQQDADTRASLANLNYLLGLANNRTNQSKVDSDERLGNRRYQSEEYRTGEQFSAQRYGADQVLTGERDRSSAAKYGSDNSLMLGGWGIDRDLLFAEENRKLELAKQKNAAEMQTALIAGDFARAQIASNATLELAKQQEALRIGLGMRVDGRAAQAQTDAELTREENANTAAVGFAGNLNKSIKAKVGELFTWENKDRDRKALNESIQAGGYGDRVFVIDGADGYPTAVVKAQKLGGFGATGGTAPAPRESMFPEVKLSPVTAPSILDSPNSAPPQAPGFLPFSAPAAPVTNSSPPVSFRLPTAFQGPGYVTESIKPQTADRNPMGQSPAVVTMPAGWSKQPRFTKSGMVAMVGPNGDGKQVDPRDVEDYRRIGYTYY